MPAMEGQWRSSRIVSVRTNRVLNIHVAFCFVHVEHSVCHELIYVLIYIYISKNKAYIYIYIQWTGLYMITASVMKGLVLMLVD